MKKYIFLLAGVSVFVFGVSVAHAQVSSKFMVGDRIQTEAVLLNVRSFPSASGTILGTQPPGSLGTILGGPTDASGYRWWNINYDNAPDGWSIENYLTKVSTSTGSNCGDVNKDGEANVIDLNIIVGVAFNGATSTYVTDVNGSGATDVSDATEEIDYVFSGGPEPTGCSIYNNQPPMNLFLFAPTTVTATTSYWAAATDPEGGNLRYSVNFGDGTSLNPTSTFPSGYTFYFYHPYSSNGTYTITFTATDQGGLSASFTKVVQFIGSGSNQPPVINSFTGPSSLMVGQSGTWYANATDPEGSAISYVFNWGSGASSWVSAGSGTTISASKAYAVSGNYTVNLWAYDASGGYASRFLPVSVLAVTSTINLPPVINSFTGPSSVYAGTSNTWKAQATDPNGDSITYTFIWGDGNYPATSTVSGPSGATVSASRTYFAPGTYTQILEARDTPYSGWVQQTRSLTVTASSTPTSTTPILPKTYPTKTPAPVLNQAYLSAPYSASALQLIQLQLSNIAEQLRLLLLQLGQ